MDLGLLVLAFGFGLIGSLTLCVLGLNALFLGYIKGKEKSIRLLQGGLFALVRAVFLMLLGGSFAFIGQSLKPGFQLVYQKLIAGLLIFLGVLFIASRYWSVPLPRLEVDKRLRQGKGSALALGALFGLDIPACTSPLVLALLGRQCW